MNLGGPTVAYFSMEVALESEMPTYSGGLGVLAGDVLRAAADLGKDMVGVTLLYRSGYLKQKLDDHGNQTGAPITWDPSRQLELLPQRTTILIEGRDVQIQAWRYVITGHASAEVPVFLLDTDLVENDPEDRELTGLLYGRDARYRLRQEIVLGIGGVEMLKALGHDTIGTFHMNEGHAALLGLGLVEAQLDGAPASSAGAKEWANVRSRCVFTTHTPVPAGHEIFDWDMVSEVLGEDRTVVLRARLADRHTGLEMTRLGMGVSRYVNGVAMRHREISQTMFPEQPISAITNGVHAATWIAPPVRRVLDMQIPEWRLDSLNLRYAIGIPIEEFMTAHAEAKRALLAEVEQRTGVSMDANVFTIGLARRATGYKRLSLLFSDHDRLRHIVQTVGPIQVIVAGKAHERDEEGKDAIRVIFGARDALKDAVSVVYLENYDMDTARLMCAGTDVWLNTPEPPHEASGTSGMKAAMNGVPSLSVLDGWWIEGHVEGFTGWSIGDRWGPDHDPRLDAEALYEKLEKVVLPLYYEQPEAYGAIRRFAIALNGSFFSARRMVVQYVENAYQA